MEFTGVNTIVKCRKQNNATDQVSAVARVAFQLNEMEFAVTPQSGGADRDELLLSARQCCRRRGSY